jgi:hypothetical protein
MDGNVSAELRALARELDYILEDEFIALADIKPNTAEAWRRRGTGPSYVIFGNRCLYPRRAVVDFLQQRTRERPESSAKRAL